MEEESSPPPCPSSVTIRRNPPRRARPPPSTTTTSSSPLSKIPNFPIDDILSMEIPSKPSISSSSSDSHNLSLKVFLRLRPLPIAPVAVKSLKARHPKMKNQRKSCLVVNDSHSVTISPPCDSSRLKSEMYNGFAHVFNSDSSQGEVYEHLMRSIVDDFLEGRSGLLAALGPSGSGKTHTVFGSTKDPGLVPRALRHIFEAEVENVSKQSRSFYLSVFEIYSEKGKGEKLSDLSPDGGDVYIQQSVVKGLKEVLVKDVAEAESLLAQAKLKRATAMTNSNSQSSRSQCIINIRCAIEEIDGESDPRPNGAVLTFVDLAGAEREKKTGNQGGRLLESNFINNTSMVFGLCLRSLLEHQKNPKKPLQKHFQSSLLTRYLRDYLEGRKRMALILTVRPGEEDYFDTSFLLRQASPYMEIKFHNIEETSKLPGNKRRYQTMCSGQQKRVKSSGADTYKDHVEKTIVDSKDICKETELMEAVAGHERDEVLGVKSNANPNTNCTNGKIEREYYVMRGFAKALWNVLKQYKERVKTMQNEIDVLTENLRMGSDRCLKMEKELYNLKTQCPCHGVVSKGHGVAEPECREKGTLGPAEAQCASHPQHEELREEEHKCSTSDSKESMLIQEQRVHNCEVTETSTSAVKCQWNDSERRPAGNPDSKEEDGFIGSSSVPIGSEELQDLGPTDVSMVHQGDFPTSTQILDSRNEENSESDVMIAILRKPSLDATMSSLDNETSPKNSFQAQHSVPECEVSGDTLNGNDCYKYMTKNGDAEEPIGDAACLPQPHVMDVEVHGERSACNKEEKENVAAGPENNFSPELRTNQTSQIKPLNAKRPKRRLMPASSLLLRDVSGLDITDGSERLRRGRGGQKSVEDECQISRGNASLFRLLKNHLPR